jgi:hypothetical protein
MVNTRSGKRYADCATTAAVAEAAAAAAAVRVSIRATPNSKVPPTSVVPAFTFGPAPPPHVATGVSESAPLHCELCSELIAQIRHELATTESEHGKLAKAPHAKQSIRHGYALITHMRANPARHTDARIFAMRAFERVMISRLEHFLEDEKEHMGEDFCELYLDLLKTLPFIG